MWEELTLEKKIDYIYKDIKNKKRTKIIKIILIIFIIFFAFYSYKKIIPNLNKEAIIKDLSSRIAEIVWPIVQNLVKDTMKNINLNDINMKGVDINNIDMNNIKLPTK